MRLLSMLLLLLCAAPLALGLGVTPATVELTEGYDDMTFAYRVLGTTNDIDVRVEGPLAQHILLEHDGYRIEGRVSELPDMAPGTYENRVIVTELAAREGVAAARAEIGAGLVIEVPRPEAYLDAAWEYSRTDRVLLFTVMLENLGTEQVRPDELEIVLGQERIMLARPTVGPAATEKIAARHVPVLQPGVHDATLRVRHGTREFEDTKQLVFGTPALAIDEFVYRAGEIGTVKPVDISGTVGWNRPVELEIRVFVDNETVPAATTTVTAQDSFDERLYLEDVDPRVLRATVRAGDAQAEAVWRSDMERRGYAWLLLPVALVLIALALFLLWYLREE